MRNLLLLLFLAAALPLTAQQRQPQSIVIKFRTVESLAAPTAKLTSLIKSISPVTIDKAGRILPKPASNLLSVKNTYGLERAVVLPLRNGIDPNIASRQVGLLS